MRTSLLLVVYLPACIAPPEKATDVRFDRSRTCAADVDGDGICDDVDPCVVGAPGDGLCTDVHADLTRTDTTSQSGLPASPGDLNGDGFDDLLVGDAASTAWYGQVRVHLGSAAGIDPDTYTTMSIPSGGWYFGFVIEPVGDINGDGWEDLAIGGAAELTTTGMVWLYAGGPDGLSELPISTVTGWYRSGENIAGLGDVNGDGYGDIAIGAPYAEDTRSAGYGQVRVYHGSASGIADPPNQTLSVWTTGMMYGSRVAKAGDVDGDGYADLLVGQSGAGNGGVVRLYPGSATGVSSSASWTVSATGGDFGFALLGDMDLDGDGATEVVTSNYYSAKVYVYERSGTTLPSSPTTTLSGATGGFFGVSMAKPGDLDGDGFEDLLVGAYRENATYLYHGGTTGPTLLASVSAPSGTSQFGAMVAPAGDVNGDGAVDISIADTTTDDAYVYLGLCQSDSDLDGVCDAFDAAPGVDDRLDADGNGVPDILESGPSPEPDCADGDVDGDGACADVDCDPYHPLRAPGLEERIGDGVDNDCDGVELCFADPDGDGWIDGSTVSSADADCADAGEADAWAPRGDCDPNDAAVNPGATEVVGDEVDGDCDGAELCFADADLDGTGAGGTVVSYDPYCDEAGELPAGAELGDCDDGDPDAGPGFPEVYGDGVDQDCDGGETCLADVDGDGWAGSTVASADLDCVDAGELGADAPAGDCNDANSRYHPGAMDAAGDGQDRDCTGADGDPRDDDGDGFIASVDCDDGDPSVRPGAGEVCNGRDDNCDGDIDEGVRALQFEDLDGDGAGTNANMVSACPGAAAGFAMTANDCDDTQPNRTPGRGETCDGVDNDCDGKVDEDPGLGCGG